MILRFSKKFSSNSKKNINFINLKLYKNCKKQIDKLKSKKIYKIISNI